VPEEQPGFCKVATLEEIAKHGYALTPGRYVGADDGSDDDAEPFEERMPKLAAALGRQFAESERRQKAIRESLEGLGYKVC
jgi:type I restriction enzyme M protein